MQRHRRLVAVVDLAAVLALAEPAFEFACRRFEGGVEAVGAGFATDDGSTPLGGDLDVLAILPLAAVALVIQLDVEEVDGAVEAFQARQLLGDVVTEVVGDLDVSARHRHLGVRSRFGRSVSARVHHHRAV